MKNHLWNSFTLVELLLVVVLVAILGGISLVVLNPQRQIRKSQESVLRSNVAKICSVMTACMGGQSGTSSTANCNQVGRSEVSVVGTEGSNTVSISEPDGATYTIGVTDVGTPTNPNSYVSVTGSVSFGSDTCSYKCVTSNNFSAQTVDGSSREPGQVYSSTPTVCLLD